MTVNHGVLGSSPKGGASRKWKRDLVVQISFPFYGIIAFKHRYKEIETINHVKMVKRTQIEVILHSIHIHYFLMCNFIV